MAKSQKITKLSPRMTGLPQIRNYSHVPEMGKLNRRFIAGNAKTDAVADKLIKNTLKEIAHQTSEAERLVSEYGRFLEGVLRDIIRTVKCAPEDLAIGEFRATDKGGWIGYEIVYCKDVPLMKVSRVLDPNGNDVAFIAEPIPDDEDKEAAEIEG